MLKLIKILLKLIKILFQTRDDKNYRQKTGGTWYQFNRHGDAKNHMKDPYWSRNKKGDGASSSSLINKEKY